MPEIKDCLKYFRKNFNKDIKKFAEDNVFPQYIFTERVGKKKYGYCTHCKKTFDITNTYIPNHNKPYDCPKCKKKCTIKTAKLGRKYMVDEVYFVYYEKSLINPDAIVARGIYAFKDYRNENYKVVKAQYADKALYIFEVGNTIMLERYAHYGWLVPGEMHTGKWSICSSIYSEFGDYSNMNRVFLGLNQESIVATVLNTPFQYSTYDEYLNGYDDMIKFFDLYSKYPCIEQITKVGLKEVVKAKLNNGYTYGAINWHGKTIFNVLKLNKRDLKDIRASGYKFDTLFLKLMQISKADGSNLSIDEIYRLKNKFECIRLKDMYLILKYSTLRKSLKYIEKQYELKKNKDEKVYSSIVSMISDWKDYINDCIKLEMNLNHKNVLYPSRLYLAHQNTIKQVKIQGNILLDKKIEKRLPLLEKKYFYESKDVFIRPAKSSAELIEEGKNLSHCVGTYAENYANGRCDILFIRKKFEPHKSYFTMEIKDDDFISQVRGVKNCNPNEEVKDFVESFKKHISKKKKIKKSA